MKGNRIVPSGVAVLVALILTIGIWFYSGCGGVPADQAESFAVNLDRTGPYLVLVTAAAGRDFAGALTEIQKLHPEAVKVDLDLADLNPARDALLEHNPRFALLLVKPDELDVNVAWRWLRLTTEIDADPFVDVRSGFITGETPEAAAGFVRRIASAVSEECLLPMAFVDNLGPNGAAAPESFRTTPSSFMIPVMAREMEVSTISHGKRGFSEKRMGSMDKAGLVHFGGHGYPDGIVDCLRGPWVRKLTLSPCVVFNGACYNGVTGRWFEIRDSVREQTIVPGLSFCLGMLTNNTVAYLASLHPDHGLPVYQEIEFMAVTGASLGEVMKHTHDGVILGSGGGLPELPLLKGGEPVVMQTPGEIMLRGTAARVLFGDPALTVGRAFAKAALDVSAVPDADGSLIVTARLLNDMLRSSFTDTFHSDLAAVKNGFNDRALVSFELPYDFGSVTSIEVLDATTTGGKKLRHRLVGWGVELDGGRRLLHVQVDLPSSGYMQSEFRTKGSTVKLNVTAE